MISRKFPLLTTPRKTSILKKPWLPFTGGDEVWVLRNKCLRIVSGWEQSSTKQKYLCAARVPGGVTCKGNARYLYSDLF